MKKLLFLALVFASLGAMAQTQVIARHADGSPAITLTDGKDTGKKIIPLPAAGPPPAKVYYLVLPEDNWIKILAMLRRSTYPSNEIDDAVTYILQNAKELNPPAADTSKPKK